MPGHLSPAHTRGVQIGYHGVETESVAHRQPRDVLERRNAYLFSTPVINVFRRPGEPIGVTHQEVAYPVVADASHAASYDIYSIDSVNLVRQTQMRSRVIEFQPIFSQHYGDDPR